jgi:hypothetical protein
MQTDSKKHENPTDANNVLSPVFSEQEVRSLIQAIYSEFAETNWKYQNTETLKGIIKTEVEQHPLKPVKIFVK